MRTYEIPSGSSTTRSDQRGMAWPDPLGPVAIPQMPRHATRMLGLAGYVMGSSGMAALSLTGFTTPGTPTCSTCLTR